jgi:hypothetical protein
MDIHIQPDPNPLESKGKNSIGFGFSPIHSQEQVVVDAHYGPFSSINLVKIN